MTRPVIGVTTWRRRFDTELGTARPMHVLGAEYAAPIEAAGGAVVMLPPTEEPAAVLARLDALVISGGEDVDPSCYGRRAQAGASYDADRDAHEIALVRDARARNMPTLAICRGLQITNVAFGGTLMVDLPETEQHRRVVGPDQLAQRHSVTIDAGTGLAEIYDRAGRTVNSIHHQAIERIADGFHVVARATDGVIEAIEPDDAWPLRAVQWHPEKLTGDEACEESALYAWLVTAARRAVIATDTERREHQE